MNITTDSEFYKLPNVFTATPIPVTLKFYKTLQDNTTIHTLEGSYTVDKGTIVMIGLEGEEYCPSPDVISKRYTNILYNAEKNTGFATKKVDNTPLMCAMLTENIMVKTWKGMIQGDPHCVVVRYGENDFGVIQPHLFSRLYKHNS